MSDFMAEPESSSSPRRQDSQMQRSPSSGRSHHRHHHRRSNREGSAHQSRSQMLEFNSAMSNFASMFPTLDTDVIESVLRANRGVVEPTIDQLIAMTASEDAPRTTSRKVHSPPAAAERAPDEAFAERARSAGRPEDLSTDGFRQRSDAPPALPPKNANRTRRRQETVDRSRTSTTGLKAPLVGALPDDFLRVVPDDEPQSMSSLIEDTRAAVAASNTATMLSTTATPKPRSDGGVPLKFLTSTSEAQLAEDERIALYFQNAEFMTELRRNRDFIQELERDRASMARDRGGYVAGDEEDTHVLVYPGYFSNSERPNSTHEPKPLPIMVRNETMERQPKKKERPKSVVSAGEGSVGETADAGAGTLPGNTTRQVGNDDMAAFQHRLRHMGQSTRKKFFQLAKKFQRHRGTMNLDQAVAGSTLQLIDDDSDDGDEQRSAARMFSPEKSKELGSRLEFVTEWPAQESKREDDDDDELLDVDGIDIEISPRTQEPGAHNEPIIFFSEEDDDLPLGAPSMLGESRA